MCQDKIKPLEKKNDIIKLISIVSTLFSRTSKYGSLEFEVIPGSARNGGEPPVVYTVAGVGKVIPKAF